MLSSQHTAVQIVLYEGEGAAPLLPADRHDILTRLLDRGYVVTRATASAPSERVQSLVEGRLLVLGDFHGEAPDLEDAQGEVAISTLKIRGLQGAEVLEFVEEERGETAMNQPGQWKPWFPVIDYDRYAQLHAVSQLLPFRCLWSGRGSEDSGSEQRQLQDQLSGLFASVP